MYMADEWLCLTESDTWVDEICGRWMAVFDWKWHVSWWDLWQMNGCVWLKVTRELMRSVSQRERVAWNCCRYTLCGTAVDTMTISQNSEWTVNGVVWPQDVKKKPRRTRLSKRFRFVVHHSLILHCLPINLKLFLVEFVSEQQHDLQYMLTKKEFTK